MRNLHAYIKQEYGWESISLPWQWGKIGEKNGQLQESPQIYHQMPKK